VLEQLGDPDAVLEVGLAAGDLGDLGGVGEDTGEGLLEGVEDRPPVDPRALHRHVRDAVGLEPIPERQQLGRGGAEGLHVLNPVPVCARHPPADRHCLLVDIQTRTSLEDLLHRRTSMRECVERTQEHPRHDFARRARRQQCGVPEAPPSVCPRTRGTDKARRRGSCARRAVSIAHFHDAGWAEGPCRFVPSSMLSVLMRWPGAARRQRRSDDLAGHAECHDLSVKVVSGDPRFVAGDDRPLAREPLEQAPDVVRVIRQLSQLPMSVVGPEDPGLWLCSSRNNPRQCDRSGRFFHIVYTWISSLLVENQGRNVICGQAGGDVWLMRLWSDGAPDYNFGTEGTGVVAAVGADNAAFQRVHGDRAG
jgi:hypothetical protein